MEVGDHALHVLRPLGTSRATLGRRAETVDAELDPLGIVARLAEGHQSAQVAGLRRVGDSSSKRKCDTIGNMAKIPNNFSLKKLQYVIDKMRSCQ